MSSLAKPTAKSMVRGGKVSGHSGHDQYGGNGPIMRGRGLPQKAMTGAKLVRGGKAPGAGAKRPKIGLGANPIERAFSHPDTGIPHIKGSGGKGGRV